jgi:WhiB family redox-sensing transcriptional regulator
MDDATCAGCDEPELFHPHGLADADPDALVMCRLCPVAAECLQYALDNGESGVWGGTTDKEREAMGKGTRPPIKPTRCEKGHRYETRYGDRRFCRECDRLRQAERRDKKRKNEGVA